MFGAIKPIMILEKAKYKLNNVIKYWISLTILVK